MRYSLVQASPENATQGMRRQQLEYLRRRSNRERASPSDPGTRVMPILDVEVLSLKKSQEGLLVCR
jgi:hypothetical protein